MRLYDIDTELEAAIEAAFDPETGELLDEAAFERMNELQLEREKKIEGVALWIKNLSADAEALKHEKEAFAAREKATKNKLERLKGWMSYALNGEKFKTDKVAVGWRRSESVEISDELNPMDLVDIDPHFIKLPPPEFDKIRLKAALKEGIEIPGVKLVEKQNIQIK